MLREYPSIYSVVGTRVLKGIVCLYYGIEYTAKEILTFDTHTY